METITLYRVVNGKKIDVGENFSIGEVPDQTGASCTAYQGVMDGGKGRKVVLKKQHREAGEEFASYLERVISDWKENQAAQNLSSTQSFTDYGIFADKETCLWLVQQQQAGTRLDHLSLDDLSLQDVFEMADSLLRYAKDIVDNGALPTDLKPANIWVPYAGGKRERRVTFFDVNSVALRKERIKTVSDTWRPFEGSEHYPGFPESYGEWSVTYTIGLIILYLLLEKEDREQLILRVKNGNEAIYTYPFEHFRTGHDILHGKLGAAITAFFSKAFAYGTSIDKLKENRFTVDDMIAEVQHIRELIKIAHMPKVSRGKLHMNPGHVRRPELCNQITEAFNRSNIVFLSGISGCGKSWLAVEYACINSEYEAHIHMNLPESGEEDVAITIANLAYDWGSGLSADEKVDLFKAYLASEESSHDLILIDNYNSAENDIIVSYLSNYKGKVLITTQLSATSLHEAMSSEDYPIVFCEDNDIDLCQSIFTNNMRDYAKYLHIDDVNEMVEHLLYHPLLSSIVSKQIILRANPVSAFEALLKQYRENLHEALSTGGSVTFRHNSHRARNTPLELLSEFMASRFAVDLTNNHRAMQCLWGVCLDPGNEIDMDILCELIGDEPSLNCFEAVDTFSYLANIGLVQITRTDIGKTVKIHNLLAIALQSTSLGTPPIEFFKHMIKNEVAGRFGNSTMHLDHRLSEYIDSESCVKDFLNSLKTELPMTEPITFYILRSLFTKITCPFDYAYLISAHGETGSALYIAHKKSKQGSLLVNASSQKLAAYRYYPGPDASTTGPFQECDIIACINTTDTRQQLNHEIPSHLIGIPVTAFEDQAFYNCNATKMTTPSTLERLGYCVFMSCQELTKLDLTASAKLSFINHGEFLDCGSIDTLEFPDYIVYIGDYAFQGCTNLDRIHIPSCVSHIGSWAFRDCKKLSCITIPSTTTYIGEDAFSGCNFLTIRTHAGSYSEQYAQNNNLPVVLLDDIE